MCILQPYNLDDAWKKTKYTDQMILEITVSTLSSVDDYVVARLSGMLAVVESPSAPIISLNRECLRSAIA